MPVYGTLERALGKGGRVKVAGACVSITGTGSIDTGLKTILPAPIVSIQDAPASIPTETVEITSISGGTISVVVISHTITAGAEHAVATVARRVGVIALGE